MRRRQLIDAFEGGLRARHVVEREIVVQRLKIDAALDSGVLKDRLDFGAEQQAVALPAIKERLDAVPIPRQV